MSPEPARSQWHWERSLDADDRLTGLSGWWVTASMISDDVTEPETVEAAEPQPAKAVDDRLIDELVSRAQARGLQLTGEVGCCSS